MEDSRSAAINGVPSALKSLANTTQTLRVKESTIGSRGLGLNHVVINANNENSNHNLTSGGGGPYASPEELVQYPPDIISTTIERKSSGSFWGSSGDLRSDLEHHRPVMMTTAAKTYKSRKMHKMEKNLHKRKSRGPEESQNDQETYAVTEATAEAEAIVPDASHLLDARSSRCSDDGTSMISEMDSMILNHGLRSRLVSEPPIYCDTGVQCDPLKKANVHIQVTTDESSIVFEVKRENANLKGRLESLNYVVEEMSKERSTIQAKIHSLEKEIRAKSSDYEELLCSKQRLLLENEDLKSGLAKWETIVADYQEVIENKIAEVNGLKEDLAKLESDNESLKINLEQLRADLERKELDMKALRKSVVDKDLEIENVCRKNVHLKEEVKYLNTELESKSNQRDYYLDEVSKIQARLTQVQQKMITEQSEALRLKTNLDKVQSENYGLKQELIKVKHKAYDEKQLLLKNLEGIGAELLERTSSVSAEAQSSSHSKDDATTSKPSPPQLIQLDSIVEAKDTEIAKLKKEVQSLKDENSGLAHDKQILTGKVSSLQKSLGDIEFNYSNEKCHVEELETKIRGLKTEIRTLRDFNELMRNEKAACEEKVELLSRDNKLLENTTRALKDTIEKHDRTIKQMRGQLVAKENKLDMVEREKIKAENMVSLRDDEIRSLKDLMQKQVSNTNHGDYYEIKLQKAELEKIVMTLNSEIKSMQVIVEQEMAAKNKECESHRRKLEELTNETKRLQSQVEDLTDEKMVLEKKLEEVSSRRFSVPDDQSEYSCDGETNTKSADPSSEKIRRLESNLKLVLRKYKEAKKAKQELEALNVSLMDQVSLRPLQVPAPLPVKVDTCFAETQTEGPSNEELTNQLESSRNEIENLKLQLEENQRTILRFEHEKGKVGLNEDTSLRQQISSLESILSTRNTEVSQLSSSLREVEERFKDEVLKLNKKIQCLEEELKKERALLKDSRRNVYMEKRENNQLKRDIGTLKKGLTESNQIADKRKQELSTIEVKLEEQQLIETKLRNQIEELTMLLEKSKAECESLRSEIQQSERRDNALLQEVKNLSLTLKEKNQEIKGIKLDIDLIQKKYDNEKKVLQDKVDSLQVDLVSMKSELTTTRKEKFTYQSKVGELRAALKSSVEQNKKLSEQLENQQESSLINNDHNSTNDFVDKILEQSQFAMDGKKPLIDLQSCVESLKSEMESLQQQMQDYSS